MERQVQAYLGQWYDMVGATPQRRHHQWNRWRRQQPYYGGYGDGYGYGYDQQQPQQQDPYALFALFQQLQQQQQQPQYIPVPVPAAPAAAAVPVPVPTAASGWYDIESGGGGNPLLPRAAVVDAPLPTQANRDILPMSTGVPILPTQSAQITGRPQTLVFKIGRFMISNAGTAGGAADWIVNDIKIGNRSQFVQSGDVPGDLFATNAIDTFVRFEAAQTAMDVVVVVTYIGLNESGCPFFGAMVGTAAV